MSGMKDLYDPAPRPDMNLGWGSGKNVILTPTMRSVFGMPQRKAGDKQTDIIKWDDLTEDQRARRDEWLRQLHIQAETDRRHKYQRAAKMIGGAALTGAAIYALAPVAAGGAGVLSGGGAAAAVPATATTASAAAPIATSGMTTGQWVNTLGGAASSYMSANEQNKVAREAAKSKPYERNRIPYGNEYLARLYPYILRSQQQVFENRMRGYGLNPQDFSSYQAALAGIPDNYSGVGR